MSIQIHGRNVALEAISANANVEKAFVMEGLDPKLLQILSQHRIYFVTLSKDEFKRKFPADAQGITLEISDLVSPTLEEAIRQTSGKKLPLCLMLDGIEDPHNLGAILRSAEAGGVDFVIIPKHGSAKLNATVMKTSAGAAFYVPIVEVPNLNRAIEILKKQGFWVVGTALGAGHDASEIFVDRPLCLVIGNEGSGMRRMVAEHTDLNVEIAMVGHVNSLNASVSAGILIFDILRRKRG